MEEQPLLQGNDQADDDTRNCEDTCGGFFHAVFHLLCSVSGPFMLNLDKYELSWPKYIFKVLAFAGWIVLLGVFLLLNMGSLVFDLYAVIHCPFPNCGFIAGPIIDSKGYVNITKSVHSPVPNKQYYSYQDAVITVATVSGSFPT